MALTRQLLRPARRLRLEDPGDGSRIGGPIGTAPLPCGICGGPLFPLVQLRLAELPEPLLGWLGKVGWLVVRVCGRNGEFRCHQDLQFPETTVSRVEFSPAPVEGGSLGWPLRGLGFSEELGDELPGNDQFKRLTGAVPAVSERDWHEQHSRAHGDKLGGWPINSWMELPRCAECGASMRQVLQFTSGGASGLEWGDADDAFLLACEQHPGRATFIWAGG